MPARPETSLRTIGDLARRFGVAPSALRFYEERGLLEPEGRTRAGYRLYGKKAEQTLHFIQRAQRLGFSLADIATLLEGASGKEISDATVVAVSEQRLVSLQKQLTELMVLQHELELFLRDVRERMRGGKRKKKAVSTLDSMLQRVCDHDHATGSPVDTLEALLERTGCKLAGTQADELVSVLRGRHIHVWREGDGYSILVATHAPEVARALDALAQVEADCHAHDAPVVRRTPEGLRFDAHGENAFLFAHFFLVVERAAGH